MHPDFHTLTSFPHITHTNHATHTNHTHRLLIAHAKADHTARPSSSARHRTPSVIESSLAMLTPDYTQAQQVAAVRLLHQLALESSGGASVAIVQRRGIQDLGVRGWRGVGKTWGQGYTSMYMYIYPYTQTDPATHQQTPQHRTHHPPQHQHLTPRCMWPTLSSPLRVVYKPLHVWSPLLDKYNIRGS